MIRHPFYILICLAAVSYLAVADVRGWSVLQSLTRGMQTRLGPRGGSTFHHK